MASDEAFVLDPLTAHWVFETIRDAAWVVWPESRTLEYGISRSDGSETLYRRSGAWDRESRSEWVELLGTQEVIGSPTGAFFRDTVRAVRLVGRAATASGVLFGFDVSETADGAVRALSAGLPATRTMVEPISEWLGGRDDAEQVRTQPPSLLDAFERADATADVDRGITFTSVGTSWTVGTDTQSFKSEFETYLTWAEWSERAARYETAN